MTIGDAVKLIRISKQISQKDLAERVQVTRPLIAQIESNRKLPGLQLLTDICAVLEVPLTMLFFLVEKDAFLEFAPSAGTFLSVMALTMFGPLERVRGEMQELLDDTADLDTQMEITEDS